MDLAFFFEAYRVKRQQHDVRPRCYQLGEARKHCESEDLFRRSIKRVIRE
jgi:hypothetical protein